MTYAEKRAAGKPDYWINQYERKGFFNEFHGSLHRTKRDAEIAIAGFRSCIIRVYLKDQKQCVTFRRA